MYQRELTLMLLRDAKLFEWLEAIDLKLEAIEAQRHSEGGPYPAEWEELLTLRANLVSELYCRGLDAG